MLLVELLNPDNCCIDCGYSLQGLAVNRCPECNRPFDPADSNSYVFKVFDGRQLAIAALKSWSAIVSPVIFTLAIRAILAAGTRLDSIVEAGVLFLGLIIWMGGPMYGWVEAIETLSDLRGVRRRGCVKYEHPALACVGIVMLQCIRLWPVGLLLGVVFLMGSCYIR